MTSPWSLEVPAHPGRSQSLKLSLGLGSSCSGAFGPAPTLARCLCCPSALSAPLLLCSPVRCFPSMALPSLGSFMEVEGSGAGSFWPSCGVRCGQAWGLWGGSGFDPGALKVGQSCFVACKDASSGWGRFQASSEPGLVLGWGTWHRVTLKCCSEAGATPLSRGHQEARRALPVGLAPFPCLAWASSPPAPGRAGEEADGEQAVGPYQCCTPTIGFLPHWASSSPGTLWGGGALQHMKESLPLIIRSDESLLGKK